MIINGYLIPVIGGPDKRLSGRGNGSKTEGRLGTKSFMCQI